MVRPSRSVIALLLGAASCALVLALMGGSRSPGTGGARAAEPSTSAGRPARAPSTEGSTFTLMQMNLCLSGLASCYRKVAYPAVVEEAVALIRETRPDAVTFNEACRNDADLIARRTGYHLRFSIVIYGGGPFRCIRPGDRGVFGDAVLTKDRSRAARAMLSRHRPTSSGAGGYASPLESTSTCAPRI